MAGLKYMRVRILSFIFIRIRDVKMDIYKIANLYKIIIIWRLEIMVILLLYSFDMIFWKTQSSFEEYFGSLCYIGFAKRARVFLRSLDLGCA